jgi:hypothetical protein
VIAKYLPGQRAPGVSVTGQVRVGPPVAALGQGRPVNGQR